MRDVHEGRAEVVQMWGRPESVRREFRKLHQPVAVARVVALVPDLLFGSKIHCVARRRRA